MSGLSKNYNILDGIDHVTTNTCKMTGIASFDFNYYVPFHFLHKIAWPESENMACFQQIFYENTHQKLLKGTKVANHNIFI